MTPASALARLGGALALAVLAAIGVLAAEPAKPGYLAYLEFAADDTPERIALKQAYNDAVHRYNRALYDYLVTLEKHDRLAEVHNSSSDPAERRRVREQAQPLRAKLADFRREVMARAAAVDQAARRAAAGGVTVAP